jgi:single-strand DNA-binding protein
MAKGLNRVQLIGNLGQDPEKKYLPDGAALSHFSLATAEGFKNRDGEWEEHTEWHSVTVYGKLADIVRDYLHKGSKVYIEGRLRTRSWEDGDKKKHYKTEVVGTSLIMLDAKKDDTGGAGKKAGNQADEHHDSEGDGDLPF